MQLKEIEKLAASVMERAVDAKEVAGVNLLVLKDKAPVLSLQAGYADLEIRFNGRRYYHASVLHE